MPADAGGARHFGAWFAGNAAFRTSLTRELANGNGNGRPPAPLLRTALCHVDAAGRLRARLAVACQGQAGTGAARTTRLRDSGPKNFKLMVVQGESVS